MTKKELDAAAQRLEETTDKFVNTVRMMLEASNMLNHRLGDFTRYLDAWQKARDARSELMESHLELSKELCEVQKQVLKAYADNNLSITENSARLDKLITKVEGYFGTGEGLEYDN
jgi:ABC-type transporter Mla subunit MlaD